MALQLQAIKPVAIALNVFTLPGQLSKPHLQSLLPLLSNFDIESFTPEPNGGATLANQTKAKSVTIIPTSRQIVWPVELSLPQSIDQAFQILSIIATKLPVASYLASQVTCTSHVPVAGETAAALIERTISKNDALAELGVGVSGVGLKVFLNGNLGSVAVEPLIADPGMMFIQLIQVYPQQFKLEFARTLVEEATRFNSHNVRNFLQKLFEENTP